MSDAPIDYGYVCDLCGLSDWGHARFLSNGFTPYPCIHCRDHFHHQVLGPMVITPERQAALNALWGDAVESGERVIFTDAPPEQPEQDW